MQICVIVFVVAQWSMAQQTMTAVAAKATPIDKNAIKTL